MLVDWVESEATPDGRACADIQYTRATDVGAAEAQNGALLEAIVDVPEPGRVTGILGEAVTLDTLRVNGTPLPASRRTHRASQDLLIADARALFQAGRNQISFARLNGDVPFEPFYLMGDFGVALVATASGMRPRLSDVAPRFGDLVETGLPFYWGDVCYTCTIDVDTDAEWLDCGDVNGVLTATLNGADLGVRYTAPYRFHIGEHRIDGPNTIALRLYNTAQNLYGPHRRNYGVALHACPRRGNGNGDYFLERFGIHGPITIEGGGAR